MGVGGAEVGCSDLGEPRSGRLQEGEPLGFLPCWGSQGQWDGASSFAWRMWCTCVPRASEALICLFSRVYLVPHVHPSVGLRGCGPCVCGSLRVSVRPLSTYPCLFVYLCAYLGIFVCVFVSLCVLSASADVPHVSTRVPGSTAVKMQR